MRKGWFNQLIILAIALSCPGITVAAEREINPTQDRLLELASHVQYGSKEAQQAFARIALYETYQQYVSEWEKAKQYTGDRPRKVRRWRRSTEAYIDQIGQYYHALDDANLSIQVTQQNSIILFVNHKPVMVDGPNVVSTRSIEKNIVAEFCQSFDCDAMMTEQYIDDIVVPKPVQTLAGNWQFTDEAQASFKTSAGITFVFEASSSRKEKERLSKAVLDELSMLADELKKIHQMGVLIDWASIEVASIPDDALDKVYINQQGDYILLSLPLLGQSKDIVQAVVPWAQMKANGTKRRQPVSIFLSDAYIQSL